MKAFISHSSKDKYLVKQIVDDLGELRCEYDEYNFEYELNVAEIRNALRRADLFVLILSQNSINSTFVKEEVRSALEARGGGFIKKILIISIDSTSYKSTPLWMQEINVSQHLRKAKQISRRIDTYLAQIALDQGQLKDFYIGREAAEIEIRKFLRKPRNSCPSAIHIVGNHGIGRRTFLKKSLHSASARKYATFIEVITQEYDGLPELHRKLYELIEISNPLKAAGDFDAFNNLTYSDKIQKIAVYIRELLDGDSIPLFIDFGGVLQDDGDYQQHFRDIMNAFSDYGRPSTAFIQSRMMPSGFRRKYEKSLFFRLNSLDEEASYDLLCLILQDLEIDYTETEAKAVSELSDGHPYNINFIAARIAEYGIEATLADPSEIILMKEQRGNEFLRKIKLGELELDVLRLLQEYRFCDIEFMLNALNADAPSITQALRQLEENCCVERKDRLVYLSPAIRDAVRRDKRIDRDDSWLNRIAGRIVEAFEEYDAEDSLSLTLIDSAIPEIIRSGRVIPFINNLILPSHFLRVGRAYYDKGQWALSIEFSRKALELEGRLTVDAKIEACRLLGLALIRVDSKTTETAGVLRKLRNYGTGTARRIAFFIEGFQSRRRGRYEDARKSFEQAFELRPENYHINRELSAVLCKLGLYTEAEPFARSAYNRSKENPYIIDVLIESLEGKAAQGARVNRLELEKLYDELKLVSEMSGTQFHSIRLARRLYGDHNPGDALRGFEQVLSDDEDNSSAIYHRCKIRIELSDFPRAADDIKKLRGLKSEEADLMADELDAKRCISEGNYVKAKEHIVRIELRSSTIATRLYSELAKTIGFAPLGATSSLRDWAKNYRP